ncbi:MAG: IS30 family transposase [Acidimicrobiaceae bacterium]|nr:IS30 family transposase [Acidimicrobiaceae bacterium]
MRARSGPRAGRGGEEPPQAGLVAAWVSADLAAGGRVCAETICRCAYSSCALGADAWRDLPRRRRCRKPRSRAGALRASPLGDYRPISERPAAVADRAEPGHWEGDLIVGAANKTAAATLVERTSRHTLAVPLPHGCTAVAAAVTAALARQPAALVRTLTRGQGRELARWTDIEAALGIEVYFREPHSPWQRPTNEQTNGLLRRWLPKGTPLDLNPQRLSLIEDNLNTMPRRLHNRTSAADTYTQLTHNHQ